MIQSLERENPAITEILFATKIFFMEYPPTDSGSGDTGPLPCVPLTGLIVAWAVRGGCGLTSISQFTRSLTSKTKIHQSKLKQCFLLTKIQSRSILRPWK